MDLQAKLDSLVLRSVTRDFFPHAVILHKEEVITIMEVETTAEDLVSYTELIGMILPPDIYCAVIGQDPEDPAFISFRYGELEEITADQFEEDQEVFRLVIKRFQVEQLLYEESSEDDEDEWL